MKFNWKRGVLLLLPVLLLTSAAESADKPPLQVSVTVPDLGSLVQTIGGDRVSVTVFAKGTENAHFVAIKPSFIKTLSGADLLVAQGLELEIGWIPPMVQSSRNFRIQTGSPGFLDVSTAISPLEVPTTTVDRSMGDVHPFGNPHFMLDPLNGLKVAGLIRDRLGEIRPEDQGYFQSRYDDFRKRLGAAFVGEALAQKYDFEKLVLIHRQGELIPFLKRKGEESLLGGWIGALAPYTGFKVVGDHNQWIYFTDRFGFPIVDYLEPKPGVPPTMKHLTEVIDTVKTTGVKVLLLSPYFDPKAAEFVSKEAGIPIAELAHQVGARPEASDYFSLFDYNVRTLKAALEKSGKRAE